MIAKKHRKLMKPKKCPDCGEVMIGKDCKNAKTPNAETIKALEESERGEGLQTYDSVEDFFKAMGL